MHGGLLWAAFEEWAAHHHSARRSIGLHRHAASEPHRLLLGPVPAAGRPARQRAWPTWAAPQTSRKKADGHLKYETQDHEYYDFYGLKLMDTIAPIDSYSWIP